MTCGDALAAPAARQGARLAGRRARALRTWRLRADAGFMASCDALRRQALRSGCDPEWQLRASSLAVLALLSAAVFVLGWTTR